MGLFSWLAGPAGCGVWEPGWVEDVEVVGIEGCSEAAVEGVEPERDAEA